MALRNLINNVYYLHSFYYSFSYDSSVNYTNLECSDLEKKLHFISVGTVLFHSIWFKIESKILEVGAPCRGKERKGRRSGEHWVCCAQPVRAEGPGPQEGWSPSLGTTLSRPVARCYLACPLGQPGKYYTCIWELH